MKIGVFANHGTNQIGGGATFPSEILKGLRAHSGRHEFYSLSFFGSNAPDEGRLSLTGKERQKDILGRFSRGVRSRIPFGIGSRFSKNILSAALNNLAETYGLGALYYPTPQFIPSKVPAVITVWDLAHRLYPFFPEVGFEGWTWENRETFYRESLPRCAAIITGTETGKKQAIHFYGLNRDRVKVLPFPTPSFVYELEPKQKPNLSIDIRRPFVFYPAQFWPHKNHFNLLKAISELQKRNYAVDLVLCGSDQGNLGYVRRMVSDLGLLDRVHILGFVERQELLWLYSNCAAMIFPSFFGPDNLPPLEAMALGAPVAAAAIDGAVDQLGNAAVFFDPNKPIDIANKIQLILTNKSQRQKLRTAGKKLSQNRSIESYISGLLAVFDEIASFRNCWTKASLD